MCKPLRPVPLPQWRSAGVRPPTGGAATITGYRIFYDGGEESYNVSAPSFSTYIGLTLEGDQVGHHISIRSERLQLFSELINVTITCESQIHHCKK